MQNEVRRELWVQSSIAGGGVDQAKAVTMPSIKKDADRQTRQSVNDHSKSLARQGNYGRKSLL
jgi:hypothetical protein